MTKEDQFEMLSFIVDHVEVGVFAIDRQFRITLWNGFMVMHSGLSAEEVMGRNLFDCFPELPLKWLEKKIQNVFLLKNYAFTTWEQRPYGWSEQCDSRYGSQGKCAQIEPIPNGLSHPGGASARRVIQIALQGALCLSLGRTHACPAINLCRAIHKLLKANSVVIWAVFFLRPR